jgi:hypothetical protein
MVTFFAYLDFARFRVRTCATMREKMVVLAAAEPPPGTNFRQLV